MGGHHLANREKKKKGVGRRAAKQVLEKHAFERAGMGLLAVALLWLTSLSMWIWSDFFGIF